MAHGPGHRSWPNEAAALAAVLLMFLVTWELFSILHDANFGDLADVALGVIDGRPRSLAFQNRLIGPWLVQAIAQTEIPFESALRRFHLALLLFEFFLLYFLVRNFGVSVGQALGLLAVFAIGFLGLQYYWYHTWDILDLIVFTVFSWGVMTRKPVAFFAAAFLLALLNRESALFIALFIVLNAFGWRTGGRPGLTSRGQLAIGIIALLVGITVILVLRSSLYVGPPAEVDLVAGDAFGNEIHLVNNLWILLIENPKNINVMHTLFLFVSFGYFASQWKNYSPEGLRLFVVALVMIANILFFAIIGETRNMLILLPLFVFLLADITANRSRVIEKVATAGRHST